MPSDVRTGTVLAGFRIESQIGEGAMGTVYLAEDTRRGGSVALKVLVPELAEDERFRKRLLRESKLAASLDHPHVVPILDAGEDGGVLYLAMEHVEGIDLRELRSRPVPGRAVRSYRAASPRCTCGCSRRRTGRRRTWPGSCWPEA